MTDRGRWVFGILIGLVAVLLLWWLVELVGGDDPPGAEPGVAGTSPTPEVVEVFQATATFYGPGLEGGTTASGEQFDAQAAAAAHATLPFGTPLRVTHSETDRSVEVVVNDRLPDAPPTRIDLTVGAAQQIGLTAEEGTALVTVEVLAS